MKKKKAVKYARERFEWWRKWLGLNYGDVSLTVSEYIESVDDDGNPYVNLDLAGECHSDWRYQESNIELSLIKLRELDKKQIEKTIVHELMHIFLNEMREGGINHEERVATNLQKAFLWVRDGILEELETK